MCGIAGVFGKGIKVEQSVLKNMADSLLHRGPDGEGFWINPIANVGFAHRRLSIIDLSTQGSQPMRFEDLVITFNGEIYNYTELREHLLMQGVVLNTITDTEVILGMYKLYGYNCLNYFDGMFAFAIYDHGKDIVFIARDRFGEKPFYYSLFNGNIYFASELKALFSVGVSKVTNKTRFVKYLINNDINNEDDGDSTFYQNILECEPSTYLVFSKSELIIKRKYWSLENISLNDTITETEAIAKFRELLVASVRKRLRADVAVGSSLSGGIDSSTIVSIIENNLAENQIQKTFSARFTNYSKDESKFIDLVLKNKHKIVGVSVFPDHESFVEDFENLINCQEEPFGSASQYLQYSVMRLAYQNRVTVLLDGQGADEFLGGYLEYYFHFLTGLLYKNTSEAIREINSYQKVQRNFRPYRIPRKLPLWILNKHLFGKKMVFDKDVRELMLRDTTITHLKSLLRYGDKNAMAFSTEVRLPFLDHKLVEFVFSLPIHLLLNAGWTKYILRKSFADILPNDISWRVDKIGFEPPQANWLKYFETRIEGAKKVVNLEDLGYFGSKSAITDWKWLMLDSYAK